MKYLLSMFAAAAMSTAGMASAGPSTAVSTAGVAPAPAGGGHEAAPAAYRLVHTVRLGAPERWDYVVYDAPSHRVYVSHGDRISVVDGRSGRIVGEVTGMPGGTHGIAISHAAGRGYTDDGRAGQAVSFDLASLKVLKRLKAEDDADAVTIDPVSGHVFVVDGDPGTLTAIDPLTDTVVATISAGSKLEYAVPGGNGKLYVNGVAKRVIYRIDTATNRVDATWPIPQCESPHGLAIDTATHRLFSSCENEQLTVVNADTGAVVASVPIGRGTDAAAFDPAHRLVFSSNGTDGTVTVIREVDAETFVPAGTVTTRVSARTMSVDPHSGRLYVVGARTTAAAMAAFRAAMRAHQRPAHGPFAPGSLELMMFDPIR
ncbi:MAG TPA: YncE family protein [Steroidobacteraceae bacterium]|nr:YncE family protein [Steroidobacteraceae bacterium]